MKRKLFTQIRNEWRDNVWMILELAIVTGAIWVLLIFGWEELRPKLKPTGYDTTDVYSVNIRTISKHSPLFQAPVDSSRYDYFSARRALISNITRSPLVETVGIGENALPYNFSYYGSGAAIYHTTDTILGYYGNQRTMSPGMVRVLRLQSLTGKSAEQLEEMLSEGKILLSDNESYSKDGRNPIDAIGKRVIIEGDSARPYVVGDIIRHMRRNEFEHTFGGTIVMPMNTDSVWGWNMAIRVKPGKGNEFTEAFKTNPDLRRFGNVYLTDLQSFKDIRRNNQRPNTTQLATFSMLAFFLLVVIFLGLLGTFWFRMQQRVGEVAIRMVCGATRSEIFRRVISEGLILLLFGVVLISAVLWPFKSKLDAIDWVSVLVCELVAILLVALGVVVSLWWPARRIMKIEPAVAVKEE